MDQIKYKSGYKYQLHEDFVYQTGIIPPFPGGNDFVTIKPYGTLLIKRGYAWDGPSGPAIDTKNFMRGSLVHDALYQLIRLGNLSMYERDEADRLLQKICIEDGMSRVRAWWVYNAVAWFGETYMRNNKDALLVAP